MSSQQILFKFARRYPQQIVLSVLLGVSGAIFNGVGTTLIVPAVFELLGGSPGGNSLDLNLPPLLLRLTEPFTSLPDGTRAIAMLGFILLAIVLKNVANYFSALTTETLARSLTRDMREEGIQLLLAVDLDYHYQMRTGDIIQRLNDQIGRAVASITTAIGLVRIGLNILFFAFVLLSISWRLTGIATVFLLGVMLLNRYAIGRSKQYGRGLAEASRAYSVRVLETLNGIRLVKASAAEQREQDTLHGLIQQREEAAYKSQMNAAVIPPLNEILTILALVGIIFVSQFVLNRNSPSSATVLLTFLFVLSRMLPFIGQLNTARSRLANISASVEMVYDFLRRDNKPFMVSGSAPYRPLQTGIHFENLSFRYPNSDTWALRNVDLYLPKGQTLALVGASGAGKSTLADLLPRFYDPVDGRITLDGQDLRSFDLASLRRNMGIVSQDTFLFNASIRDNIAYPCPNATDTEVMAAAQQANAYEFIMRLPQGFDTPIGDRGVLLSGGQRQRLAIARALLQNPDLLILDEATSALDTVSERLVQAALENLSKERTTLVIAHRLSTIRNADQIAVLEGGQVIEVGTHDELLHRQGAYANLYAIQFTQGEQAHPAPDRSLALQTSHGLRTHLNSMLGALQLIADGVIEVTEERQELTEEAYQAALSLLRVLETSENGSLRPDLQRSANALPNGRLPLAEAAPSPRHLSDDIV